MTVFFLCRLLLFSASSIFILHYVFFLASHFVWSIGTSFPTMDYTPWTRNAVSEHDGIEVFVLYGLVLLHLAVVFFLNFFWEKLTVPFWRRFFIIVSLIMTAWFIAVIGFNLPMAQILPWQLAMMVAALSGLFVLCLFLLERFKFLFYIVLFVFLAWVCFIPTSPQILFLDYAYILAPAYRLINGFSITESYSQYDYFMTYLAACWMKCNGSPYYFYIVLIQVPYFIFFFGMYFLARKLFLNSMFALPMLVVLVIIKIYGNLASSLILCPQVSPLRLDLWVVLLALVFWKGASHWSVGSILGIFLLVHHAFGMIYSLTYMLLIGILFLIDLAEKREGMFNLIKKHIALHKTNLILVLVGLIFYKVFLVPVDAGGVGVVAYATHHIGFLPISKHSFYWYVAVIFSVLFLLLLKRRSILLREVACQEAAWFHRNYFETGLFLLLLAMGNSFYFFGRSHENNIINISSGIILSLFMIFDIICWRWKGGISFRWRRTVFITGAFFLVSMVSFAYSGKIAISLKQQWNRVCCMEFQSQEYLNFLKMKFGVYEIEGVVSKVKKAIFLSHEDFFYYYHTKMIPGHFRANVSSFIFKNDFIEYVMKSLNEGVVVVAPIIELNDFGEIVQPLLTKRGIKVLSSGRFLVIYDPLYIMDNLKIESK